MQKLALGAAWLLSLAVTAWLSVVLTRPTAGTPAAPVVAQAADETLSNARFTDDELQSLQDENASLRSQLDAARRATMQQAMAEMLRQAKESAKVSGTTHVPDAGAVFTGIIERQRRNSGMFGGLDEGLRAIAAFAQMGDEGVEFLLGVTKDEMNYSEDERRDAKEILATLPHPDALKFFLQKMDADLESSSETDHREEIYWQALTLNSEAIAPYSDKLNAQAGELMVRGDPDLMCVLGLYHANPVAAQRLHDPAVFAPETFKHVLHAAERVHTDQAYDYLVEAQQMVKDPDTRSHISEVLDRWEN